MVHALVSLCLTGGRVPAIRTHTEETAHLVLRERVCQCQLWRACLGAVCVVLKNLHGRCHHSCMEQPHTHPLQFHSSHQSRLGHSHMCTFLSDPVNLQKGEGEQKGRREGRWREKGREERRKSEEGIFFLLPLGLAYIADAFVHAWISCTLIDVILTVCAIVACDTPTHVPSCLVLLPWKQG